MTIQQFVDDLTVWMVGSPFERTVDTIKCGDSSQELRGVACTFMATRGVLDRAAALGANLVITHEPSFYNHLDETDWLAGDQAYQAKRDFLEAQGMVLWRVHDYLHRMEPDGINLGVTQALGWPAPEGRAVLLEKPVTLAALAAEIKSSLGILTLKFAGPPEMSVRRIGLRLGSPGGRSQIEMLQQAEIDVVVCGESPEWEACEYVRDSVAAGVPKGLLVLGHAHSEEAGMAWLADRINERGLSPGVVATHLPAGDPFLFL